MKKILGLLLLRGLAAMTWLYAAPTDWLGSDEVDGQMAQIPRSIDVGDRTKNGDLHASSPWR